MENRAADTESSHDIKCDCVLDGGHCDMPATHVTACEHYLCTYCANAIRKRMRKSCCGCFMLQDIENHLKPLVMEEV